MAANKEIRVSPYRLATHLSMAFTTYCLTLWTALDILNPHNVADKVRSSFSEEGLKFARNIRGMAAVNALLVATTVLSGAYVAGNDAGRAYNTFPMMNDEWVSEYSASIIKSLYYRPLMYEHATADSIRSSGHGPGVEEFL